MNGAKEKWSTSEGIYILASTKVNGKNHWLQGGGTDAIWYDKAFTNWNLGNLSSLGSSTAKILTAQGTAVNSLPQVTPWKFLVDGTWTASDDITITLFEGDILISGINVPCGWKLLALKREKTKDNAFSRESGDFYFLINKD